MFRNYEYLSHKYCEEPRAEEPRTERGDNLEMDEMDMDMEVVDLMDKGLVIYDFISGVGISAERRVRQCAALRCERDAPLREGVCS